MKEVERETQRLVNLGYKYGEARDKALMKYLPTFLKPQAF